MELRSKATSLKSDVGHLDPSITVTPSTRMHADDSMNEIKHAGDAMDDDESKDANAGAADASAAGDNARGAAGDNARDASAADVFSQLAFLTTQFEQMHAFQTQMARDQALIVDAMTTHRLDLMQEMERRHANLKALCLPPVVLPLVQPLDGLPVGTVLLNMKG